MMPGQVTWQEQCQDFPVSRQEWDTVTEMQTVTREVDECLPSTTPDCHTYEIPAYSIQNKTQTDDVTVNIQTCQKSTKIVQVLKRFIQNCQKLPRLFKTFLIFLGSRNVEFCNSKPCLDNDNSIGLLEIRH